MKLLKIALLETLNWLKLISRKIGMAEKFAKYHTLHVLTVRENEKNYCTVLKNEKFYLIEKGFVKSTIW